MQVPFDRRLPFAHCAPFLQARAARQACSHASQVWTRDLHGAVHSFRSLLLWAEWHQRSWMRHRLRILAWLRALAWTPHPDFGGSLLVEDSVSPMTSRLQDWRFVRARCLFLAAIHRIISAEVHQDFDIFAGAVRSAVLRLKACSGTLLCLWCLSSTCRCWQK